MRKTVLFIVTGVCVIAGAPQRLPQAASVDAAVVTLGTPIPLDQDQSFTTPTVLEVLDATGASCGQMLVGPWSSAGSGSPTGTAILKDRLIQTASGPLSQVEIRAGWMHYHGRWPMPRTPRIIGGDAATVGTTVKTVGAIVTADIFADGNTQWVFLRPTQGEAATVVVWTDIDGNGIPDDKSSKTLVAADNTKLFVQLLADQTLSYVLSPPGPEPAAALSQFVAIKGQIDAQRRQLNIPW